MNEAFADPTLHRSRVEATFEPTLFAESFNQ
jgi:hypothetical protein